MLWPNVKCENVGWQVKDISEFCLWVLGVNHSCGVDCDFETKFNDDLFEKNAAFIRSNYNIEFFADRGIFTLRGDSIKNVKFPLLVHKGYTSDKWLQTWENKLNGVEEKQIEGDVAL